LSLRSQPHPVSLLRGTIRHTFLFFVRFSTDVVRVASILSFVLLMKDLPFGVCLPLLFTSTRCSLNWGEAQKSITFPPWTNRVQSAGL